MALHGVSFFSAFFQSLRTDQGVEPLGGSMDEGPELTLESPKCFEHVSKVRRSAGS